jgi:signal transduction histidine kinase
MAHEIIKLHGGDLTIQSKLGEGTTFTATLPLE